jgi:hypothetical protein
MPDCSTLRCNRKLISMHRYRHKFTRTPRPCLASRVNFVDIYAKKNDIDLLRVVQVTLFMGPDITLSGCVEKQFVCDRVLVRFP